MTYVYTNLLFAMLILVLAEILILLLWSRLANIYYKNVNFFDLLFIVLYPLEEIVFLILYYFEPCLRGLWVSLVVIIICSTVVIDKWLLKKQSNYIEKMQENSLRKTDSKREEIIKDAIKKLKFRDDEKYKLLNYVGALREKITELKTELKKKSP